MNEHDFDNLPAYPGYQGHTEYLRDELAESNQNGPIDLTYPHMGHPLEGKEDLAEYQECAKALGLLEVS